MFKPTVLAASLLSAIALLASTSSRADALHDGNVKATEIIFAARMPPGPSYRATAISQTAVYEAVNAITGRYGSGGTKPRTSADASIDAAIAAAHRGVLSKLMPAQQPAIDAAYQAALGMVGDGPAKTNGIAIGEASAAAVLAARANDGAAAPESYRPVTTAGAYVPTLVPLASTWPQRQAWALKRGDQFRPGPPPGLGSARWTNDFNESKALGSKNSSKRTAEQTDVARFWEATSPVVYFPVVRSVTESAGREVTRNARVLALAAQAMDDALIAVFDAKYTYNFWRPTTAIRNGDIDGNDATEREASWLPLVDTPMHPEYPCAHCILAASVGAVLQADIGTGPVPPLQTTSPNLPGAVRRWSRIDDFVAEVANARVWGGMHYRNSTEVGQAMGRKIGEYTVHNALKPLP